jgi:hypothetical protein
MKFIILSLALTFLMPVTPSPSANIKQFAGKWVNTNPNTRGLSTLQIEVRGRRLRIHAWGKCHPSDCAWGQAIGTAHAPSVQANQLETVEAVTTLYITSFSQTILIIRPIEGDQLRVESFTRFTDESSRADYTQVETFSRVEAARARNE